MIPVIFTDFRREMIARTLFDLVKIAAAAAFASKFFFDFPKVVQLMSAPGIVALGVVALLICPPKKPKE